MQGYPRILVVVRRQPIVVSVSVELIETIHTGTNRFSLISIPVRRSMDYLEEQKYIRK